MKRKYLHKCFGVCVGGIVKTRPATHLQLLRRSERNHKKLEKFAKKHKSLIKRDHIVCARIKKEFREGMDVCKVKAGISDWVPVLQLTTLCNETLDIEHKFLSTSVTSFAREVYCALTATVPSMASGKVPPQHIEYGVETGESFEQYVYPAYQEGSDLLKGKASTVFKKNLKQIESIRILFDDNVPKEGGSELTQEMIKKQYRKMSMLYHPDRQYEKEEQQHDYSNNQTISTTGGSQFTSTNNNQDQNAKGILDAYQIKFRQIQESYNYLSSQQNFIIESKGASSWYESLGGRERLNFHTVELVDNGIGIYPYEAKVSPLEGGYMQALKSLHPKFVMFFIFRNRNIVANGKVKNGWGKL